MVMELANNDSLFNLLKKTKKLSEDKVTKYMDDVIKAVEYLHSKDPPIIHRDIKPENVLICDDTLKIADFGWSNYDDEIRNTFCGTPDYLSPEMILGTGHNEKLDIWGLGVLMFELLHGRPPFSPKKKIRDRRLLQKTIEENVLNGKLDFDLNISTEAKSAIRIMLNPKGSLRPYAKDLFELDFFKKNRKPKLAKSMSIDTNSYNQKLLGLEHRLTEERSRNSLLQESLNKKDSLLNSKIEEIKKLKNNLTFIVS